MKTIKFITLGCKVNQYDTQNIREQFCALGLSEVRGNARADVYLINTCTVTHRSDSDSLYYIRKSRRENPKARIILTGCFSELDAKKIKKENSIDLIIKNKDKDKAARIFARKFLKSKNKIACNSGISHFEGRTRAFIKIQDGCNNYCSYCRVPHARGKSSSRSLKSIVIEAEKLAVNGFKEIVLCGVCLGAYGRDLKPRLFLVDVITALEKIPYIFRIRLSSIEAMDVSKELIDKMAVSGKLCKHLHIPIQSGDDRVLKAMNRRYTSRDYLDLIKAIKSRLPDIAITTDVLVGFPTENEESFNNTVKLVKKIMPLKAHVFSYSPRPGTAAESKYKNKIDIKVIQDRLARLKQVALESSLKYKKHFLNKMMEVLVEDSKGLPAGQYEGYTSNYIKTNISSKKDIKNKIVSVKILNFSE